MTEYIKTLLSKLFPYNSSIELPYWDYRAADETVRNCLVTELYTDEELAEELRDGGFR